MTSQTTDNGFEDVRRMIRVVMLLEAAELAGLAPLPTAQLHTMAYLANVLAPVASVPVLDGRLLKRANGPFYPSLQAAFDRLVGMGLVQVNNISYRRDDAGRWMVSAHARLNRELAGPVLQTLIRFSPERAEIAFIRELLLAASVLSDSELAHASSRDAAYSDPIVAPGNVVDFAEWTTRNQTADAAQEFATLIPGGATATPGERLHLYLRHVRRLLQLEI